MGAGSAQEMKSLKLGFLSTLLCKWQSQATLIGKTVLPVLLLVRLATLGAAAQTAWLDDKEEFTCGTQQPGCEVVCLSEAVPLSPARLWTLQLVAVLAPGLVFLCYLIHITNQETQGCRGDGEVKGHALRVYLICVASAVLVEAGFVVAQASLFDFWVDTHYQCSARPCPWHVECTIPHAWKKTVFLVAMFTASCVSLLLGVAEGVCVVLREKKRQPDLQFGWDVQESWCFPRQLLVMCHSNASVLGKTVLPVLQLIQLIIVVAAVQPVWHQDLRNFVCYTQQSGCKQAAFNIISHFSLYEYWTLQVVLVLAPGLIFFCYLVHLIVMETKSSPVTGVKDHVRGAYLGYLFAVVLIEVGFAVVQAFIFGFSLHHTFNASVMQCLHKIECYVSQAREKTVFMVIMFSVACLSGLLTLVEMCVVLKSKRPQEKHQGTPVLETSGLQMELMVKEEAGTEQSRPD